jgi:hypothetical protein
MNSGAIIGFIIAGVIMGVGVLIWANIETSITCPNETTNPTGNTACNNVKTTVWTVLSIAPFTLFFGLIAMFVIPRVTGEGY